MSPLVDARAREVIARDLDKTLVVEAAAGTGKTTALISRIVAVIRSGRDEPRTSGGRHLHREGGGRDEAAAACRARSSPTRSHGRSARAYLEQALAALEVAHINTIHGFCADLLRERPVEAGIDPQFAVLDETAAEALLRDAFRNWFERALSDPGEGLRRMLRRRNWRAERTTPREELLRACRDLVEYRDFDTPWAFPDFEREPLLDELVLRFRGLGSFKGLALRPSDPLARAMAEFQAFVDELDARERAQLQDRDYDTLEVELSRVRARERARLRASGSGKLYGQSLDRNAVIGASATKCWKALTRFLSSGRGGLGGSSAARTAGSRARARAAQRAARRARFRGFAVAHARSAARPPPRA